MKKRHVIIWILMFVLFISNTSIASDNFQIKTENKFIEARKANVNINGSVPTMDAPAIIIEDRTLVPVRFIADEIGAKVDWIGESRSVIITYKDKLISLTIDNEKVHIGENIVSVDKNSIPRLVTFPDMKDYPNAKTRTMVPARFISEVLGFEVDWDGPSSTVIIRDKIISENLDTEKIIVDNINIEEELESDTIKITANGEIEYNSFYIPLTNKIVVDIKNARLDINKDRDTPGTMKIENEVVEKIQYSQFTLKPFVTRVVVTLYKEEEYKIELSKDKNQISVIVKSPKLKEYESNDSNDGDLEEDSAGIGGVSYPLNSPLLTKVGIRRDDNESEYIYLEGLSDVKYDVIRLEDPKRYVIDIKEAIFGEEKLKQYPTSIGGSNNMKIAQFSKKGILDSDENVVRVVFDIKDNSRPYPNLIVVNDTDGVRIIEDKGSWDNFVYSYDKNEKLFISIKNIISEDISSFYNEQDKTLLIKISNNKADLPVGNRIIYSDYLQSIETKKKDNDILAMIKFKKNVQVNDLSDSNSVVFEVKPSEKNDSGYKDSEDSEANDIYGRKKRVVIDAGHGGKDAGAVPSKGVYEKDINLTVSLKLEKALRDAEYEVIMTRNTDHFIELLDRPKIANDINADLFISVHANANRKSEIRGLEVIYCPANECDIKTEDQHPFAKSIYDNIVALTGREFGRGIVKGSRYVVVNKTSMPAIILEIGYMTNPEEGQLIWTEEYQSKIVEGVINGVNDYFE